VKRPGFVSIPSMGVVRESFSEDGCPAQAKTLVDRSSQSAARTSMKTLTALPNDILCRKPVPSGLGGSRYCRSTH
jgi:hypothetical protein